MNIFILDENPEISVQYYVDSHVVKIPTECYQMISMIVRKYTNTINNNRNEFSLLNQYSKTHINHPCTKWIGESWDNFMWAYTFVELLATEHRFRYNKKEWHLSYIKMVNFFETISWDWIQNELIPKFPKNELTQHAMAINNLSCIVDGDPIQSYRNFYNSNKRHLFSWKNREIPYWIDLEI